MTETAAVAQKGRKEAVLDVDIYCGSATPTLARAIAERLQRPLGRRDLHRFDRLRQTIPPSLPR